MIGSKGSSTGNLTSPPFSEIALRAYEKWVSRGRPSETQLQDWLEAEAELRKVLDLTFQLAESQEQFARYMAQSLQAENELRRQEADRKIAREIQKGLLPKDMPWLEHFSVGAQTCPAKDVGGDCFDFLPLLDPGEDQTCLGVLVADASGHGVAAALLMAETRAYLRAFALTYADLGMLLRLSNVRLAHDTVADHFVTLLLLRLDPNTRTLTYASAGHQPAFVLDSQGQTKAVLASTGLPLGIDPAGDYPVPGAIYLEPGDLVFSFTDGLPETISHEEKPFGLQRLLDIVRQHRQETPQKILHSLFHQVTSFSRNGTQDDLSAVLIKANN
jgi:sigma-B regulation protein RsbU (phosphoserine phosphatase)